MRWRQYFAAVVAAASLSASLAASPLDAVDGLGIDSLFWLRSKLFGTRHPAESSPTAVIAIDEESYRQPPFRDIPLALWTPYLAQLMNGLLDADAKVIGFDVIFSTSAQRFLPGHDRDFLLAQRRAAAEDKLVLAMIQHSEKPITPFPGYGFVVGGKNIKTANLFTDRDGVVRRVPLVLQGRGVAGQIQLETAFALEIAKRALDVPVAAKDGEVRLGNQLMPGGGKNGALVNFDGGDPIPTFSLADMFSCVAAGKQDFLRAHFGGKVVLIGAVLDVEDRKLTSRRFIVESEKAYPTPRCALPPISDQSEARFIRPNIPGVFVHAQAINDFIRGETLYPVNWFASASIVFLSALGAGLAAFHFSLGRVGLAILAGSAAWAVAATVAFNGGLAFSLLDPVIGAALASVLLISYRIIVTDKSKRRLRKAFSFYLPDSVIDRMVETETLPMLGGEEREITVWFSDLEGFTRTSERQAPQEIVNRLNLYFGAMVEIIEAHGGYIDKFVGDGIVALFGAPMILPDHAAAALRAAWACQERLSQMDTGGTFKTRIGLHTGTAVIGNIGSAGRFNYTAIGDTVNLAARLEGANKAFGTSVLLSEATWAQAGNSALMRKIGRIRVAGREGPVTVYSPGSQHADSYAAERFNTAVALAEEGNFKSALEIFRDLATDDPVAARWVERLQTQTNDCPGASADLVVELSEK